MSTRDDPAPPARLMLVVPAGADPARVAELVTAGDVAAVVAVAGDADERGTVAAVKALAAAVQEAGAALLLDGPVRLVARAGADGAHVGAVSDLDEACELMKPDRIVGAGGLPTRHDAMSAGEANVDYVMFGEPDGYGRLPPFEAVVQRIAWWAEIFEPPCVGYAPRPEGVAPLVAAGADFVALGPWVLESADPLAAVREAGTRLARTRRG